MNSFDIEFSKIQEEYYDRSTDESMSRILGQNAKIVIFGSGSVGCLVASNLSDLGGNIVAFCDNFKRGFNKRFQLPIISPIQLFENYMDAIVVVAVDYKYNDEIYNQVLKMGFPKEKIFRRYSGYELYDIELLKQHHEGYKWAYDFFQDELSKKIILNRIRSYLFYHEMEHLPSEEQYFDQNVIRLSDHEIFVDGGAYTGDTTLEFIKRVNGKYNYVYAFEPETDNFEQAKLNIKPFKNIEIVNKGLWNKEDTLSFSSGNGSSQIVENGTNFISLTSLDIFFTEKQRIPLPTFIKLDIEGAEKQAIIGAKNIITNAYPKLAICVYHKPEDIYELPKLIMELGNYKLFLRHYSKGDVETVMYAI